jgi:hypothetical protein
MTLRESQIRYMKDGAGRVDLRCSKFFCERKSLMKGIGLDVVSLLIVELPIWVLGRLLILVAHQKTG